MTEATDRVAGAGCHRISGGAIVLVVGPSGAGKDTLLRLAKAHFGSDERIVFPRRLITRGIDAHEDHDSITPDDLRARVASGGVALAWRAHGLDYAVPASVDAAIADGCIVVVNVSRRIIAEAMAKYARAVVVYVTAPASVLAERLKARGRETAADVAGRLDRADSGGRPDGPHVVVIDNSDDPTIATRRLIDLIEGLKSTVVA